PLPAEIACLQRLIEEKQNALGDIASADASKTESIEQELTLLRAKLNSAIINKHSFKLKTNTRTCNFKVTPHDDASTALKMSAKFTQIPVNSSDAITGHNLQGLTKDTLVVYEWDSDTCWIYVVLSRVRTLKGLYLIRPIRKSDIKPASREYHLQFMKRME
ncbi:hypothetical protein THAOC_35877, partial [Thalassiosira oceanica]